MRRSWLVRLRAQPNATARLVCVPYAGGGASAYQAWSGDLPDVEVWAAELPGRERRFAEPAATSIDEVVEPLADAITAQVRPPWVLFGHSMGGLVAWRLAELLYRRATGDTASLENPGKAGRAQVAAVGSTPAAPACLFLSGTRPPNLPAVAGTHDFDDASLLAWLSELGGLPAEVVEDRQLVELILPTIRADLKLCDTFDRASIIPLPVPLVAFAGTADPLATVDEVAAWHRYAAGGFRLVRVRGDHFFLHQHRRQVTHVIGEWLRARPSGPRPGG